VDQLNRGVEMGCGGFWKGGGEEGDGKWCAVLESGRSG